MEEQKQMKDYIVDYLLDGEDEKHLDPVLADALSTALFVMGRERAMEFYASGIYTFEAIFTDDDTVYLTPGVEEAFSLTGAYDLVKRGTIKRGNS